MKCNVCGQEFGNGAYCQHCKADRITALGNYSGGYNAPEAPKNITSNTNTGGSNPTSGYGSSNANTQNSNNSSERYGVMNNREQFMVCYHCANVIPADSEYCPCCRTKLFEVCPKCGHRYSSQYEICNKCGTNKEEYLEEQRILEQQRQEEARRREAEQKRQLEEQRKIEREQREEERRRQEAARKEEEARQREIEERRKQEQRWREEQERRRRVEELKRQREEAAKEDELKGRILQSEAYKEASNFINNMHSCVSEKSARRIKRRTIFSNIFKHIGLFSLLVGVVIYIIGAIISDDWTSIVCIGGYLIICGLVALLIPQIFGGSRLSDDNARLIIEQRITRRLSESYYKNHKFHNEFARQAAKKYVVYYGHRKERQEGLYDIFRKMVSPDVFNRL